MIDSNRLSFYCQTNGVFSSDFTYYRHRRTHRDQTGYFLSALLIKFYDIYNILHFILGAI